MATAPLVIRSTDWRDDPDPPEERWSWDVECRTHEWWRETDYPSWAGAMDAADWHWFCAHH